MRQNAAKFKMLPEKHQIPELKEPHLYENHQSRE